MASKFTSALVLALVAGVQAHNTIGSQGSTTIDTDGFTLELDIANQVAIALTAKPGSNAGSAPFNFLLPTVNRTENGFYALGDIQIRMRPQDTDIWANLTSHHARRPVTVTPGEGNDLTTADITTSLGEDLPIRVARTWSKDQDSIVLTFNITNIGNSTLQFGGVGIPIPINNNWVGMGRRKTWTECVISDAAVSLDAGYVITKRLTGEAPTLIVAPVGRTPLEQWRLNYGYKRGHYPPQWLDGTDRDYNFEGLYSWWIATAGLEDLDRLVAAKFHFTRGAEANARTDFLLEAGASRIIGLRFLTASGPRHVETRLPDFDRPTIVGVPGFVAATDEQVKLVIRSTSAPSISDVSPANIIFGSANSLSDGLYAITGTVNSGAFGQTRVTITFENGEVGTAHYSIINSAATQLDNLGAHRFEKSWYTNEDDFFQRAPGIIAYDNKKQQQVIDDERAYVAGMSDEAGSGAYVSATAKQLLRPKKEEVAKLEQFATQTLWGKLQISTPGHTYGGVKKSLFYYDAALEGTGVYLPHINHTETWAKKEADRLDRSFNYPHVAVVWHTLYRLARNHEGLTTVPWSWYLDRGYDTIIGMKKNAGINGSYASLGLMEGSYFLHTLLDHEREGATNATLAARADDIRAFMKRRAHIWAKERYPYASEFAWDNTGQEEVYFWSEYFNNTLTAASTIESLMAVMASVPHWGVSGTGRDLWDFLYSAELGRGQRFERLWHHYKGAQSAYALVTQFQSFPTDIAMLRAGWGGVLGPLTTIQADGFGSTGFHSRPDYMNWDPLSGDNGVTIALHALSTRAIAVNDPTVGGWAGFGASVSHDGNVVMITPTDSSRRRVFIADNALYMELDAGYIQCVSYDLESKEVIVTFDPSDEFTPHARIRWSTTAQTASSGTYSISGDFEIERGCSVVPLGGYVTTVTLTQL